MNCGQGIELTSLKLAVKEGASVERNIVRMSYVHSWKDFVLCSSLPIATISIRVSFRTVLTPISQENDSHRTHSAIWIRDRPGWALFGLEDYTYDWLYVSIDICRLYFTLLSVFIFHLYFAIEFSRDYDELVTIDPNSIDYADYVSRTLPHSHRYIIHFDI